MDYGGQLQNFLGVAAQLFLFSDGLCHCPDPEKMVDVMEISVVKGNHFFNSGCNDHILHAPF